MKKLIVGVPALCSLSITKGWEKRELDCCHSDRAEPSASQRPLRQGLALVQRHWRASDTREFHQVLFLHIDQNNTGLHVPTTSLLLLHALIVGDTIAIQRTRRHAIKASDNL